MNIKKTISTLDKEITKLTDDYNKLHQRLDKHRGVELNDFQYEEVKKIIDQIQDKYAEIYDVAFWVINRNEWANNIGLSHHTFLKQLIEIGAIEKETKIIQ